jgi:hypothetical protein
VCLVASGGEEDIQNMLQEKAVAAGGFSAPAASLCLEELGVGTPAGWLHRGLLLQVRTSTQSSCCSKQAASQCITVRHLVHDGSVPAPRHDPCNQLKCMPGVVCAYAHGCARVNLARQQPPAPQQLATSSPQPQQSPAPQQSQPSPQQRARVRLLLLHAAGPVTCRPGW